MYTFCTEYEGSGQFCVVTVKNFHPLPSCVGDTGSCFAIQDGRVAVCQDMGT